MRPLRLISSAAVSACLIAGCGASPSGQPPTSRPTPAGSAAPALIQIENHPAARPQSGLAVADVVFEYVTEGGITRFSALYLHPPSGRVGPIRSARLVTIELAKRLGAVLIYSGASTFVQQRIEQSGIERFDEDGAQQDFFRVSRRSSPHNLYSDGSRIADLLSKADARRVFWELWPRSGAPSGTASPAASLRVPISFAEQPVWTYDAASGGYTRRERDTGPMVDADSGRPVVVPTVVVEQVAITEAPEVEDVSGAHGVEQDILSGGAAQVFTAGREYDATWSQGPSGLPRFTMKNGTPAPVAPGEVWIELVPRGQPAQVA